MNTPENAKRPITEAELAAAAREMTKEEHAFNLQQRQARALAASDLVPQSYRNNLPNTLLALEVANRLGASPFAVMQNLHMIQGRPSWGSPFLIASINSCGRFEPLRFEMIGEEGTEDWGCVAWTRAKGTEEKYEGPPVTMAMAKAEGWSTKAGSKWKTLPGLMLRYRAASFFARLYAPELTLGLQSTEEVRDFTGSWQEEIREVDAEISGAPDLDALNEALSDEGKAEAPADPVGGALFSGGEQS